MLAYPVIVHEEDNQFWSEVPDVPGAFSVGNTLAELLAHVPDGITLMLEALEQTPKPSSLTSIKPKDGDVYIVKVDDVSR